MIFSRENKGETEERISRITKKRPATAGGPLPQLECRMCCTGLGESRVLTGRSREMQCQSDNMGAGSFLTAKILSRWRRNRKTCQAVGTNRVAGMSMI